MDIPHLKRLNDNSSIIYDLQLVLSIEVENLFEEDINVFDIEVTKTNDSKFGDFTSNIALKVAGKLKKQPREIASEIQNSIQSNLGKDFISENEKKLIYQNIEKVEVAGPGFLNFYFKPGIYSKNLKTILEQGNEYGKWEVATGQAMVEFGQPNTHKAFHVGHLKSAITGLSVVRLTQNLGYEVVKANFFGDIGMHVAKTLWGFKEKGMPEGFEAWDAHARMKYVDSCYAFAAKEFKEKPDVEAEIREINKKVYLKDDLEIEKLYLQTKEWSLEHLNEAFKKLDVVYDRQYPESEVAEIGVAKVKEFEGKIFKKDDGAIIFDGEEYKVGKWVFITGEGNPTYSAKDLGLGYKKFEEYPNLVFNITTTSVEQRSYFMGVIKALELTDKKFEERYFNVNFGWMLRGGKKFSSRMGESIKGMDVIQEATEFATKRISESKKYSEEDAKEISEKVAISGLKFLILSHELHTDINYDPEEFLNPEGFSGPYVLYAYVRAKSILREAGDFELNLENYEFNDDEKSLLKVMYQFPFATLSAGKNLAPHVISNYIFELAQEFNKFYKNNKVLTDDSKTKNMRLALTQAVSIVLQNGLYLLGIETIEKM